MYIFIIADHRVVDIVWKLILCTSNVAIIINEEKIKIY